MGKAFTFSFLKSLSGGKTVRLNLHGNYVYIIVQSCWLHQRLILYSANSTGAPILGK